MTVDIEKIPIELNQEDIIQLIKGFTLKYFVRPTYSIHLIPSHAPKEYLVSSADMQNILQALSKDVCNQGLRDKIMRKIYGD